MSEANLENPVSPWKRGSVARNERGFSLLEMAIVLGVFSAIVAGVWAVANSAYESSRREQFAEQLFVTVKNVRASYLGQAAVCGTFAQLTTRLVAEGAIPGDMVRGHNLAAGIVDSPWGSGSPGGAAMASGTLAVGAGTYAVASGGGSALATPCAVASSQQYFTIELRGLRTDSCIAIVTRNSGSSAPPGLVDVVINTVSMVTGAGTSQMLPVQVKDASTNCATAAAAGSTVDFVYRLRPPSI